MNKDNGFKYYSKLSLIEQAPYQVKCYAFLKIMDRQYPHFDRWYRELFSAGYTLKEGREIIFCEKLNQIAGIIILKNDGIEKKICTLRVATPFQGMGIATDLVKLGIEWLACDKPLITVSSQLKSQYDHLFRYFGFTKEQKNWGYYSVFRSEYAYNGILPHKPILIDTIELQYLQTIYQKAMKNSGRVTQRDARWVEQLFEYLTERVARRNIYVKYECNPFAD